MKSTPIRNSHWFHFVLQYYAHRHLLLNNNSTLDISITKSMKLQLIVVNIVYFLLLVLHLVVRNNRWSQRPRLNLDVVQLFTLDLEAPALGIVYQMPSKLQRLATAMAQPVVMAVMVQNWIMIIIPIITIIIVIDDIILLTVTTSTKVFTMEVIMRMKSVIWCPLAARPRRVVQFLPSQRSHLRVRPNLHP